jgi:ribonucleoside-diphosphate reductase alpha chain
MSACLLGSINLSEYVLNAYTNFPDFDFDALEGDVYLYVRALNECLHENLAFMPLKEQTEAVEKYKSIGLGYFGLGDMFIKMNILYGSSASLTLSDKIAELVATTAIKASSDLADSFTTPAIIEKNVDKIMGSDFYRNHIGFDDYLNIIPINTSLLTCAPTGSLSTMLGVSGGIEPIFSLTTWRKTQSLNGGKETSYEVDLPVVEEWKKANGIPDNKVVGWINNSTALRVPINTRIAMQAVWQSHIDNAISSTINVPEETTVEEIEQLFINAWSSGLKGVTVYRTGCARGAILTESKDSKKEATTQEPDEFQLKWGDTISCADNLIGLKRKIMSGCGSLHIKAFYDWGGNLREVFFSKGSDGGCNAFMIGLSRMASLAARSGASTAKIVDQLKSVTACPAYVVRTATKGDTSKGKNCPSAIGIVLLEMQNEMTNILTKNGNREEQKFSANDLMDSKEIVKEMNSGKTEQQCIDENICPKCYIKGDTVNLVAGGGCYTCDKCGFTKCD